MIALCRKTFDKSSAVNTDMCRFAVDKALKELDGWPVLELNGAMAEMGSGVVARGATWGVDKGL